jgi:hypothetical protein
MTASAEKLAQIITISKTFDKSHFYFGPTARAAEILFGDLDFGFRRRVNVEDNLLPETITTLTIYFWLIRLHNVQHELGSAITVEITMFTIRSLSKHYKTQIWGQLWHSKERTNLHSDF